MQQAHLIASWLATGALLVAAPAPASDAASAADRNPALTTAQRPLGYVVGDLIDRRVGVSAPAGAALEPASLPKPGAQNTWLALLSVSVRAPSGIQNGTPARYEIDLRYQLINAPTEVRTLELPSFQLRFTGPSSRSSAEVAIGGQPVHIAPLLPAHVPLSAALVRPDRSPRALASAPALLAAGVSTTLALALVAALLSLPFLRRYNAPFARACRKLRRAVLRVERKGAAAESVYPAALRVVHRAFDQTAGWSLFADRVGEFLAQWRQFSDLRGGIERFLHLSQREFFESRTQGDAQRTSGELRWLLEFAHECRARERQAS